MQRLFLSSYWFVLALGACTSSQPPATPPIPVVPPALETPDYVGAVWEPASPGNFAPSDRPSPERAIDRIVIHDIEGSGLSAVRWFQNPQAKVSSHYVIDATGRVYQMVKERDIGWHAGDRVTNARSVGIEHDGFAYRPGFFNFAEYESSAHLTRDITRRYNIPRDREHIIGHFEVPDTANPGKFGGRGGHTDPGPYWDWDTFMDLVRNDAALDDPAPLTLTLRPGETGTLTITLRNQGDDSWPADPKATSDRVFRLSGPVYLGAASGQNSAFYGPGWVSPRFVASSVDGDIAPGSAGKFILPVRAPLTAPEPLPLTASNLSPYQSTYREAFRLFKVPVAPRQPLAFGPTLEMQMQINPWEIAVSAPQQAPLGWAVKETPDGMRTVWRSANALTRASNPVRWQAVLPLDGFYDVYVRWTPGANRTKRANYRITGADGGRDFAVNQRVGGGTWRKLSRVRFAAAPATGPGVRPGQPVPAAPPVLGLVELMPGGDKGIIVGGDVRFVGPFAAPGNGK